MDYLNSQYLITCPLLKKFPHGFTTSHAPDGGSFFTLRSSSIEETSKNRKMIEELYTPKKCLKFVSQTHSVEVVWRTGDDEKIYSADAQITSDKNVLLATLVADCSPILIADKKLRFIAAIHAGWRGALNGILQNTLEEIYKKISFDSDDLLVAIGPRICSKHLEFQKGELLDIWADRCPEAVIKKEDQFFIDTNIRLFQDLKLFEVPSENIWISEECTYSNRESGKLILIEF